MNDGNLCIYCGKNEASCKSSIEDANDMLEAVRNDDLNRIKFLIQEGKSANIHNYGGYTALYLAIKKGRTNIVEYLLTLPDINLEHHISFKNVLHLSIELGNSEITKMLMNKGANLKVLNSNGYNVLHIAVLKSVRDTVKCILNKGFDVNQTNKHDETPLHLAVIENDFELVSMLLYYNADTDIVDNEGFTPFMAAIYHNCDENIQRELFKYECDYNRETYYFGNTLYFAVERRSPFIIDLIENGADVNYYSDRFYKSILAMILESCDPEIFFYVFPLTNLSILTEFKESIFISFLECNYNNEDWLKALYLILESDVLRELIDDRHVLTWISGLFGCFARAFRKRNISENEFVKFVDICLCSGANVTYKDIEAVYQVYSNNEALSHLLNMKIEKVPDLGSTLPYIFCSFNKNFDCVLNQYYRYNYYDQPKSNSVLSLLELSRNKAIVAICTRYNINSSHWYYYIVRRLNLPKIIYDLLTFSYIIN